MVEWSITTVLKTVVPRGTGGSNPSLSVIKTYNLSLTSEVGKNKKRESFLYNVPKNEESLPIFELAGIHFYLCCFSKR